jgi:uncharacterized membrane protein YfcA
LLLPLPVAAVGVTSLPAALRRRRRRRRRVVILVVVAVVGVAVGMGELEGGGHRWHALDQRTDLDSVH